MSIQNYGTVASRNLIRAAQGMLEHAQPITVLGDFGTQREMPQNSTDTLVFRRTLPFGANTAGTTIEGTSRYAGTPVIEVEGVTSLHGARHAVLPDRIETGTYALAAAMAGGEVRLTNTRFDFNQALTDKLIEAGVSVTPTADGMIIRRGPGRLKAVNIDTTPYPGFATDLQAQFMALMTTAEGESVIRETIFENRFMHVPELARLGADISVHGGEARVRGVERLNGAQVMATDLRASVSLVIAGLAAKGETMVNRVYHLDRGFERLEEKLGACGANVRRIKGSGSEED